MVPWVVSGRSEAALRAQAGRLREYLAAEPDLDPEDVGYSLAATRAAFDHRAVVMGGSRQELLAGLGTLEAGQPSPAVVAGACGGGRLAVLFTGQGSQRVGVGRQLYDAFPVFARAWDEVARHLPVSFDLDAAALARTSHAQPAIFAVEVALFRLLESWGVRPNFVAGHSVGELAAAHVAGVWSLADAARIVAARGRLMQALPPGGTMLAVAATEAEVLPLIEGRGAEVAIAAVNGPASLVLSGAESAVDEMATALGERKSKRIRVSHAFHSPLMEPMLAEFGAVLAGVRAHAPAVGIVSALTGRLATAAELACPDHWTRQAREPVRFLDAVRRLETEGATTFLEVGPDAVLTPMVADCATNPGALAAASTLRADRPEVAALLTGLARAYVRGVGVDWAALFGGARRVSLPTYAFQRRRYWLDATTDASSGSDAARARARGAVPAAAGSDGETPVRRRLTELGTAEREEQAEKLIRAELAVVLGHGEEDLGADREFTELGLTSLTAAELRAGIEAAVGLRLPAAAVFEHPTLTALARHVAEESAAVNPGGTSTRTISTHAIASRVARDPASRVARDPASRVARDPAGRTTATAMAPLVNLFQRACAAGKARHGIDILTAAACVRDTTEITPDDLLPSEPVPFTHGPEKPVLICFPSLVAPASAYQYARFAEVFRGRRDMSVVVPPGYLDRELLPDSLETVVRVHAEAVLEVSAGNPAVIVGYSSGGWLAHAVASVLAGTTSEPAGVVLLDAYLPDNEDFVELQAGLYRELAAKPELVELLDDASLTAMGRYMNLFKEWSPAETAVPTLLVAASSFTAADDRPSAAYWPLPHVRVVVRGSHLTMLEEYAGETADAVDEWLAALPQARTTERD